MKRLLTLILILCIVSITIAKVSLEVYEADGEIMFDGHDIMVGTGVIIIISSDANDYWSGGLFVEGQNRALGTLYGRDSDPNIRDYTDSHYESAGESARVWAWRDSEIWGFDLYTSDVNAVAGDWFVIDYKADDVGDCNVVFFDYNTSWDDPNSYISFSHIPTRDLNSDDVVNFLDFAIFASQWEVADCNDPNWCKGADLDRDSEVDLKDLGLLADYWLWGIPCDPNRPGEPNEPEVPLPWEDPNTVYSILDVYDSNEITIDVGETVTLYLNLTTFGDNEVGVFHIEVNISDPNLGSIDNTAYEPNNPGTARILASPRTSGFDYWGPGIKQEEGIELFGANLGDPISDGHLASFEFTCEGEGDVTLELIDWLLGGKLVYPTLKSMIIHQVDPNSP